MMEIQKYLPAQYKVDLRLRPFWIGSIKRSETSQALQKIKALPAPNSNEYSHLKRIRKKNQESDQTDILLCPQDQPQTREQMIASLGETLKKIWSEEVPISNPSTRSQFAEWSKIWPMNFVEQEIYKEIKHSKQEMQYLQSILSRETKEIVIFDEKQQPLLAREITHQCEEGTVDHEIMRILEQWPHTKQFHSLCNAYYLTKLRLLCTGTLCGMCAMALVHSRLQRIYIPQSAQVTQISEIMCCSKLNHRIKIFRLSENP